MLRHHRPRRRCCQCCCQASMQGWQTMPRHCHSCRHHRCHGHCCASKQGTADNAKVLSSALPLPLSLHKQAREGWPTMPRYHHLHCHHRRCLCMSKWRMADNTKALSSAPPLLSLSDAREQQTANNAKALSSVPLPLLLLSSSKQAGMANNAKVLSFMPSPPLSSSLLRKQARDS